MLGDEFTFIMLLSGSWNAINLIESTLPLKGAELELLIVMKRTTARPPQAMPNTVWVQLSAGLTAYHRALYCPVRYMEYEYCGAGVPHAAGRRRFRAAFIQITAHSPATQNAANIEQAFKALCTELNAQGSINIVNYSQHDEQDGV